MPRDVRIQVWRDSQHQRYIPTAFGSVVIERGETVVMIVGRELDAKLVGAIEKALGTELDIEHEASFHMAAPL